MTQYCKNCKHQERKDGKDKSFFVCKQCFLVSPVTGWTSYISCSEVRKSLDTLGHFQICPWFSPKEDKNDTKEFGNS